MYYTLVCCAQRIAMGVSGLMEFKRTDDTPECFCEPRVLGDNLDSASEYHDLNNAPIWLHYTPFEVRQRKGRKRSLQK